MQLYPSKSQVNEMLQCARQCSGRNGSSKYITFGEFCVFAREMQNHNQTKLRKLSHGKSNNIAECQSKCEVFLGGSCNPTTWRTDTAIPELQKHGISFYNPQVAMWAPELVALEREAKQSASVLLFVIDSQTRSIGGMIEVAYLISMGRCVVLVAQSYRPGQSIMGEKLSKREYDDLAQGQNCLLTLVRSRGIKVYTNLTTALQYTTNIIRNYSSNGYTNEEQITNKLRRLREVFDSYESENGEISFVNMLDAFQKLTNRELKISELFEYFRSSNGKVANPNSSISFEKFCVLMAEFTTDRCETLCTNDVQFGTFQRRCSTNNNPCNNINSHYNDNKSVYDESSILNNNKTSSCDVFLGGSYGSKINWRRDIAIPLLKKHGITYYNPALREENCNNKMLDNVTNNGHHNDNETMSMNVILQWKQQMDKSQVLLFIITNDTRSLTTMILAAHYMGLGKNVVLCIQQLPEDAVISNESITKQAIKDYNRGRTYLHDFAKNNQVSVFDNITEAVQKAIYYVQNR